MVRISIASTGDNNDPGADDAYILVIGPSLYGNMITRWVVFLFEGVSRWNILPSDECDLVVCTH